VIKAALRHPAGTSVTRSSDSIMDPFIHRLVEPIVKPRIKVDPTFLLMIDALTRVAASTFEAERA
jgi:hypothetical protein